MGHFNPLLLPAPTKKRCATAPRPRMSRTPSSADRYAAPARHIWDRAHLHGVIAMGSMVLLYMVTLTNLIQSTPNVSEHIYQHHGSYMG